MDFLQLIRLQLIINTDYASFTLKTDLFKTGKTSGNFCKDKSNNILCGKKETSNVALSSCWHQHETAGWRTIT